MRKVATLLSLAAVAACTTTTPEGSSSSSSSGAAVSASGGSSASSAGVTSGSGSSVMAASSAAASSGVVSSSGPGSSGAGDCGNGSVDSPELCETGQLQGESCTTRGYTGGTLGCAAGCLALDETGCIGPRLLEQRRVFATDQYWARPSGTRRHMVFVSNTNATAVGPIQLVGVDGSVTRLGSAGDTPFDVRFSPDDAYVAYVDDADGARQMKVYPVAGGAVVAVGTGAQRSYDWLWSQNPARLVFNQNHNSMVGGSLIAFDPVTSTARTLAENVLDSRFFPDRQTVLYSTARSSGRVQLWVVRLPDGAPRQVSASSPEDLAGVFFTPDSTKVLLFDSVAADNRGVLKVVDAATGSAVTLTTSALSTYLRLSTDGRRAVYWTSESTAATRPISGGTEVALGEDVSAAGVPTTLASGHFLYLRGLERVSGSERGLLYRFDEAMGNTVYLDDHVHNTLGAWTGPNGELDGYTRRNTISGVTELYGFRHTTGIASLMASANSVILKGYAPDVSRFYALIETGTNTYDLTSMLRSNVGTLVPVASNAGGFGFVGNPLELLFTTVAADHVHLRVGDLSGLGGTVLHPMLGAWPSNTAAVTTEDGRFSAFPVPLGQDNTGILVWERATYQTRLIETSEVAADGRDSGHVLAWVNGTHTLVYIKHGPQGGLWSARFE